MNSDYILREYGDTLLGYFRLLEKVGGTHAVEPYRFLVVGFIDEMLRSGLSQYITEEDYKALDRLLNCAMGVCLMPFHRWQHTTYINEKGPSPGNDSTYILAQESFSSVYILQ